MLDNTNKYNTDFMFDDVPVIGNKYNYGDYKLYAKSDDKEIKGFFGENRWLSNFHYCPVYYEGLLYCTSENAYQSAKVIKDERQPFTNCTPKDSKRMWKTRKLLHTAQGWDDVKGDVMKIILMDKFYRNLDLRRKLVDTGDRYLEETNHWHDNWFGYCICEKCKGLGQNNLGKILMKVREFWK